MLSSSKFTARQGQFEKSKKRAGIHIVVRHGEGVSANEDKADRFTAESAEFMEAEGFPSKYPNATKLAFFWKT